MTPIQEYYPQIPAAAIETSCDVNLEEQYAWVSINFYDSAGNLLGCRKEFLGAERMFYFNNNTPELAIEFVLQRLGIQTA